MSRNNRQTTLITQKQQNINSKLLSLESGREDAKNFIDIFYTNLIRRGRALAAKLENADEVSYLQGYPRVSAEIDKLIAEKEELICDLAVRSYSDGDNNEEESNNEVQASAPAFGASLDDFIVKKQVLISDEFLQTSEEVDKHHSPEKIDSDGTLSSHLRESDILALCDVLNEQLREESVSPEDANISLCSSPFSFYSAEDQTINEEKLQSITTRPMHCPIQELGVLTDVSRKKAPAKERLQLPCAVQVKENVRSVVQEETSIRSQPTDLFQDPSDTTQKEDLTKDRRESVLGGVLLNSVQTESLNARRSQSLSPTFSVPKGAEKQENRPQSPCALQERVQEGSSIRSLLTGSTHDPLRVSTEEVTKDRRQSVGTVLELADVSLNSAQKEPLNDRTSHSASPISSTSRDSAKKAIKRRSSLIEESDHSTSEPVRKEALSSSFKKLEHLLPETVRKEAVCWTPEHFSTPRDRKEHLSSEAVRKEQLNEKLQSTSPTREPGNIPIVSVQKEERSPQATSPTEEPVHVLRERIRKEALEKKKSQTQNIVNNENTLTMRYLNGQSPQSFWLGYSSKRMINHITSSMDRRFSRNGAKPCKDLHVGMIVAAYFQGSFCRGSLLKLSVLKALVLKIDCGVLITVDLENVFRLDEDLAEIPAQAINCCLPVDIGLSLWNDTAISRFVEILSETDLDVNILGKREEKVPLYEVPLFVVEVFVRQKNQPTSKFNVSEWLANELFPSIHGGLLLHQANELSQMDVVSETKLKTSSERDVQMLLPAEKTASTAVSREVIPNSEGAASVLSSSLVDLRHIAKKGKAVLPPSPDVKVNLTSSELIAQPWDTYDVMLAHIEDPGEFYVHIVCEENAVIDLMSEEMTDYYKAIEGRYRSKAEAMIYLNAGDFCAVFCEKYELWYRAQIVDWTDASDSLCVKYVDYGDKDVVPVTNVLPLCDKFSREQIFARRCHLAMIHPMNSEQKGIQNAGTWSKESKSLFNILVEGISLFSITITEAGSYSLNSIPVVFARKENADSAVSMTVNRMLVDLEGAQHLCNLDDSSGFSCLLEMDAVPPSQNSRTADEELESSDEELVFGDWDPMADDYYADTNDMQHDDEDAVYMVTGYRPRDEGRICKFYAAKGKCYKGEACLKEHSSPDPHGWTTDKEMIIDKSFHPLELPEEGSEISLNVTVVKSATVFYGLMSPEPVQGNIESGEVGEGEEEEEEEEEEETLVTLNNYINKKSNVKNYKKLSVMPARGQVVLAKYEVDARYYRARIIDFTEDRFKVQFVDYGNESLVKMVDMRIIEPRFLHLPFQLLECSLANVDNHADNIEGKKFLCNLLMDENCAFIKAKVIATSDVNKLEILAFTNEGQDIGRLVIESGFGVLRDYQSIHRNRNVAVD